MRHPLISASEASRLTGKTRETVSKAAGDLPSHPGPRNARLYDSTKLLARLYVGEDGELTYGEAMRKLTIARTKQVEQETRLKAAHTITSDDLRHVILDCNAKWLAVLKSRVGRVFTDADGESLAGEHLEFSIRHLPADEQRRLRLAFDKELLMRVEERIRWKENELQRSAWRKQRDEAFRRVYEAYTACNVTAYSEIDRLSQLETVPPLVFALKQAKAELEQIHLQNPDYEAEKKYEAAYKAGKAI